MTEPIHDRSTESFIEAFAHQYPPFVLETPLCDRTTGRNIIWPDNEYETLGDGYMGDDEILDDFRAGRFRVLVTNPQALAESVSLHSVCHDAVYFEYSYNLVHLLQSKDRIHRLGLSDNQKTRYYFMREKFMRDGKELSLDAVIYDRLKEKEQTMLDAVDRGYLEGGHLDDEDLCIIFERLLGKDAKGLEY